MLLVYWQMCYATWDVQHENQSWFVACVKVKEETYYEKIVYSKFKTFNV